MKHLFALLCAASLVLGLAGCSARTDMPPDKVMEIGERDLKGRIKDMVGADAEVKSLKWGEGDKLKRWHWVAEVMNTEGKYIGKLNGFYFDGIMYGGQLYDEPQWYLDQRAEAWAKNIEAGAEESE